MDIVEDNAKLTVSTLIKKGVNVEKSMYTYIMLLTY